MAFATVAEFSVAFVASVTPVVTVPNSVEFSVTSVASVSTVTFLGGLQGCLRNLDWILRKLCDLSESRDLPSRLP